MGSVSVHLTAGGGGLDLPRVAWEGGPAYYEAFSYAAGSPLADPSFFPILVDFESVTSAENVATDVSYGANGYYRLTSDSNMTYIRSAGLIAFPFPGHAGAGAETVGWNVDDETDINFPQGWGTGQSFDTLHEQVSGCPGTASLSGALNDGRLKHMNYAKQVSFNGSDNNARVYVNGTKTSSPDRLPGATDGRAFALDATSLDFYCYTVYASSYDKANLVDTLGIDNTHLRRAIAYGETGPARIRALQAMESPANYQPVYGFVEITNQMLPGESAAEGIPESAPSNAQIAGAVWSNLIHEARGIIYFTHDFNYSGSYHVLRDNIGSKTAGVATLNGQVQTLAPVLNTQSYEWEWSATVKTMTKVHGGYVYCFAMSVYQATHGTGSRTFIAPPGMAQNGTVTVLNESRTLTMTDGQFSDAFAAEYTCHIYRMAL